MTSAVPDLPVPDEALDVTRALIADGLERGEGRWTDAAIATLARRVAVPVLAAELRRLVAEHGGMTRGGDLVIDATVLTDRADELDPS